ncbi:2Fe-2S iron-sulfur cluster-binding protein [Methanohalophilus profundi]|uniref:2Fe-2S iron-sulfur cluster-binding protein n=1 Tax=Methanohalophilus profundi TaxID=2138083 RepID=UPI001CDC1E5D|nr:2Fe-2S iron-sulfur cluster-binding protein [Methanohalophilus profundi]
MVYLKIKRQDESREWYDTFEIEETPGMTVLEALFYVQEHMDGSLCFRYACRGCSMWKLWNAYQQGSPACLQDAGRHC